MEKSDKDTPLEVLANLVVEYKAQAIALTYLWTLVRNSEILEKSIESALETSQDDLEEYFVDNYFSYSTNEEKDESNVTELPPPLVDSLTDILKLMYKLVEVFLIHMKGKPKEKLPKLLSNSIVVFSIATWESFLRDYLRTVLRYNLRVLKSIKRDGKKFTIGELVEIVERHDDIKEVLIEEFLYEAFYGSIDDIAKKIKTLNLLPPLEEFPKWDKLRKYYFIRNTIVHNNGKVSPKVAEKIGINEGTKIQLTPNELLEMLTILNEFIDYVYNKTIEKLYS